MIQVIPWEPTDIRLRRGFVTLHIVEMGYRNVTVTVGFCLSHKVTVEFLQGHGGFSSEVTPNLGGHKLWSRLQP